MNTAALAATASKPAPFHSVMDSTQSDMGNNRKAVDGRVYNSKAAPRNPGPNPLAVHPWERCGLGVAPYRMVGSGVVTYQACHGAPVQPGTSCDYCGQGIMNVFSVQGKCGSVFNVGCDCVAKVCDPREGVRTQVEAADRKHRNALAKAARQRRDVSNKAKIAAFMHDHEDAMRSLPHPRATEGEFFAGKSLMDYATWMLANAGAKGRGELLKVLRNAMKKAA